MCLTDVLAVRRTLIDSSAIYRCARVDVAGRTDDRQTNSGKVLAAGVGRADTLSIGASRDLQPSEMRKEFNNKEVDVLRPCMLN